MTDEKEADQNRNSLSRLSKWIRDKFYPEFKCLLQLAWPIILMNIFRYLNPTISIIMCGHLTKKEFDGAAMGNVLTNVLGVSVELGFSTSFDTIFSQVYGSKYKQKLGLVLQRGILIMILLYLILACLLLNIEPILILLKQDIEISRLAAKYVTLYLPGLLFDFLFMVISRYLQNQNILYPTMISSLISCVFNTSAQYVAIFVYGYRMEASAIIQGTACFLAFIIQLAYILFSKVYQFTWQGIEFYNALEEWGVFFQLGIPGICMIGVIEWAFEISNFVAGALSDIQLGGQTIAFQTGLFYFMIYIGLSIATAIRCGQHLGANKPKEALNSVKTMMIINVITATLTGTMTLTFRKYIPYIFSNDEEIRAFGEKMLLVILLFQLFDAGNSSSSAVFRACGKQFQGAIVIFIAYYFCGVPLAFVIVFVLKTDIRGFWFGILTGYAIQTIVYFIIIYKINWPEEARKAVRRVEDFKLLEPLHDFSYVASIKHDQTHSAKCLETSTANFEAQHILKPSQSILIDSANIQTIIKRSVLCGIVFSLFLLSVVLKIYLPREYYVPCRIGTVDMLSFCNGTKQ